MAMSDEEDRSGKVAASQNLYFSPERGILRKWVPVLGIIALISLFLTLPEIPDFFGIFKCKACEAKDPYLPLLGGGYFAVLISISLLFPAFPNVVVARSGLIFAILLAIKLTYFDLPNWCLTCLVGHACHLFIWALWLRAPSTIEVSVSNMPLRGRLLMTLFAPIIVIAAFSSLNLTFMVYHLKSKHKMLAADLLPGDVIPAFSVQNMHQTFSNVDIGQMSGVIINFVSPSCPYCQEQLPILDAVAAQCESSSYRFINISPSLSPELMQLSPYSEWFEDRESTLRNLFKVTGFPILFVVGNDAKVLQVIPGIPQELQSTLLSLLNR